MEVPKRPLIGLRTIKTVLSVTLSLVLCSLMPQCSLSLATLGAIVAVGRTFRESVKSCLTQFAGVLFGGLFGCLLIYLFPDLPIFVAGLCLVFVIMACNLLHSSYAVALSCILFLSVCIDPAANTFYSMVERVRDISVGLGAGLLCNLLIQPYDNEKTILSLIQRCKETALSCLSDMVLSGRYPDLKPVQAFQAQLHSELSLFQSQRFPFRRKRQRRELSYLEGCIQLTDRMCWELQAICTMDVFGVPELTNLQKMLSLGLQIPDDGFENRSEDPMVCIVLNHHLKNMLDACGFLDELLALET